ncbi:MAG: hypothetical protein WC196_06555 [Bacilli bacterium]|jgi:hypothetical protein|nr:hypothetical protein [Bacilli bacterium]MDD4066266.1 hypothetical protein [Bacilli bacterium]
MGSDQEPKRQKYKFFFQVKETQNGEQNLRRRSYYDPANPYQLVKTILINKIKKQKN